MGLMLEIIEKQISTADYYFKIPESWKSFLNYAWGWCTGMTQGEGVGSGEGEGFRMGGTGVPVADSFRCLAELIQYCKV